MPLSEQIQNIIETGANSLYVGNEAVSAIIQKFEDYLKNKEILAKMPRYIIVKNSFDLTKICSISV